MELPLTHPGNRLARVHRCPRPLRRRAAAAQYGAARLRRGQVVARGGQARGPGQDACAGGHAGERVGVIGSARARALLPTGALLPAGPQLRARGGPRPERGGRG